MAVVKLNSSLLTNKKVSDCKKDGDPVSMSSNKYVDDDQFSITGTVTITEQNYDMTEMVEEEILIERRDAFSSTSNTQSFSTGSGFSGKF